VTRSGRAVGRSHGRRLGSHMARRADKAKSSRKQSRNQREADVADGHYTIRRAESRNESTTSTTYRALTSSRRIYPGSRSFPRSLSSFPIGSTEIDSPPLGPLALHAGEHGGHGLGEEPRHPRASRSCFGPASPHKSSDGTSSRLR
jgi:hypothetical protein